MAPSRSPASRRWRCAGDRVFHSDRAPRRRSLLCGTEWPRIILRRFSLLASRVSLFASVSGGHLLTTITDPGAAAGLIARLNTLTPESQGQWGRMTAHGMLCHVADVALGIRRLPGAPARPRRGFRAFVGLRTPLPWPKGIRTPAQVDQEQGGTPPSVFEADRARAITAIEAQAAARGGWPEYHPIFGRLSEWEWKRFAWRHTDHHLRQFGL